MTVAELIKFLQTMPQDAIVECGREVVGNWTVSMEEYPVDPECCYLYDYSRDLPGTHAYAGKQVLVLGS